MGDALVPSLLPSLKAGDRGAATIQHWLHWYNATRFDVGKAAVKGFDPLCWGRLVGQNIHEKDGTRNQGDFPARQLTIVGKSANIRFVTRFTRSIAWIKAARKDFETFPAGARSDALDALTAIADGAMPVIAKPPSGLGSGVMELALRQRGDAYRVIYALQIGDEIWVIHAFQKKSKSGIATPKAEIDLIRERLKRLKESLP